jgi:hypothetical protein
MERRSARRCPTVCGRGWIRRAELRSRPLAVAVAPRLVGDHHRRGQPVRALGLAAARAGAARPTGCESADRQREHPDAESNGGPNPDAHRIPGAGAAGRRTRGGPARRATSRRGDAADRPRNARHWTAGRVGGHSNGPGARRDSPARGPLPGPVGRRSAGLLARGRHHRRSRTARQRDWHRARRDGSHVLDLPMVRRRRTAVLG